MKFQDPVKWTDQEIELQADEASRAFLAFFTEWFTRAEELYAEHEEVGGERNDSVRTVRRRTLLQAVRQALVDVEILKGALSVEWIGQMLLLAREHWILGGDDMVHGLTRIERRVMEQMEAIKLAELQQSAKL